MSSTDPKTSQVRCIETAHPTHFGPRDRNLPRWEVVVCWTDWTNSEGGDVRVTIGPHESGHMTLTWEEAEALLLTLHEALGDVSPLERP